MRAEKTREEKRREEKRRAENNRTEEKKRKKGRQRKENIAPSCNGTKNNYGSYCPMMTVTNRNEYK